MSAALTFTRRAMASSPKESRKVLEGIIAVNKPQWASSAGVLRDLQTHFQTSTLFAPWLEAERRHKLSTMPRHKADKALRNHKVKVGHGGTLDPMATGVLIVGVGKGTKQLGKFLECTKSYECVVLFGAATDSYDAVGKVVGRAPYAHVTKEMVEEKLEQFRGKIMQKPSIFSALKVDGKKMYEYARAGGEVPEVAARPVEVKELELVEWLEPGSHEFKCPEEEVGETEKKGAEKLMGIRPQDAAQAEQNARGRKRSRSPAADAEDITTVEAQPKKPRTESEPAMSGALPVESTQENDTLGTATNAQELESSDPIPESADQTTQSSLSEAESHPQQDPEPSDPAPTTSTPQPQPPAARLRMTVTSGFYVRSLCHDLGLACSSLGLMSSLIRSRQGDYKLGENVIEWSDMEAGPSIWEPQMQKQLEGFMEREGWEAEEVREDDGWKAPEQGGGKGGGGGRGGKKHWRR